MGISAATLPLCAGLTEVERGHKVWAVGELFTAVPFCGAGQAVGRSGRV